MDKTDAKFAELDQNEIKKLNKMETALSNERGKELILLAYEENN